MTESPLSRFSNYRPQPGMSHGEATNDTFALQPRRAVPREEILAPYDVMATIGAFVPPTMAPSAAYLAAREAEKGNVIGALGMATMPMAGKLGAAIGGATMAMEPAEALAAKLNPTALREFLSRPGGRAQLEALKDSPRTKHIWEVAKDPNSIVGVDPNGAIGSARRGLERSDFVQLPEHDEHNNGHRLLQEYLSRKKFADGGAVGSVPTFLGADPNLAQAGYRPEFSYFDYSTAPGNAVEAQPTSLVGTPVAAYSPSTSVATGAGSSFDPSDTTSSTTTPGGGKTGTSGSTTSGTSIGGVLSGLSNPTIGSAIGTGLTALSGVPGLGIAGSAIGSLIDASRVDNALSTAAAANPGHASLGNFGNLSFGQVMSGVANGLSFGGLGTSLSDSLVDNAISGGRTGTGLSNGTMAADLAELAATQGGGSSGGGEPGSSVDSSVGGGSGEVSGEGAPGGYARGGLALMRKHYHG